MAMSLGGRSVVLALLGVALLQPGAVPAFGQEEPPAIQRSLAGLSLGDSLKDVQRRYPPTQEWPAVVERRGRVRRLRVERQFAGSFPANVQTIWLGFRKSRLAEIQLIYDLNFSRRKSAEALAQDMALVYGDPRRSSDKFWWSDGHTVLRVFNAELASVERDSRSTALRTSIQIIEQELFRRAP